MAKWAQATSYAEAVSGAKSRMEGAAGTSDPATGEVPAATPAAVATDDPVVGEVQTVAPIVAPAAMETNDPVSGEVQEK